MNKININQNEKKKNLLWMGADVIRFYMYHQDQDQDQHP